MDELPRLLDSYDAGKRLSQQDIVEVLKKLRISKLERPDFVAKEGIKALSSGYVQSGEIYSVYEQVCLAALHIGDDDLAQSCIDVLEKKFGANKSSRLRRLLATKDEANGNFNAALEKYNVLLKENSVNLLAMKRKAAVYRQMGNYKAAIDQLNDIVKYYGSDIQTWNLFVDIYLETSNYEYAIFALEEMVLLSPLCVAYHTRLAECYYTVGGIFNLVKARKHYAISLNTQAPNLNKRALYGLITTCQCLVNELDKKHGEYAVSEEMLSFGREQLKEQITGNREGSLVNIVAKAIEKTK